MTRTKGPIPPVILLVALLAEFALHRYLPIATVLPPPWHLAGIGLIVAGVLIIAVPVSAFFREKTTIRPFHDSAALVVTGPYRLSRNPMYVGMVAALLGVAVLTGSLSPFVVPVLFVPVLNARVIRHEEAMLDARFGDAYRDYRRRVRRWL